MGNGKIVRVNKVKSFSPSDLSGIYTSKMLIDIENCGSERLQINHATLAAGCSIPGSAHKPPYDEVYYVLSGKAVLNLDGVEHEIVKDTVIFIPGGTIHSLTNESKTEDFVFLTIWPGTPEPGVNGIYDMRKKVWGKTYVEEGEHI